MILLNKGGGCAPSFLQSPPVRFTELDIFGVYVTPMAAMMVVAEVILLVLRRAMVRSGFLRLVLLFRHRHGAGAAVTSNLRSSLDGHDRLVDSTGFLLA